MVEKKDIKEHEKSSFQNLVDILKEISYDSFFGKNGKPLAGYEGLCSALRAIKSADRGDRAYAPVNQLLAICCVEAISEDTSDLDASIAVKEALADEMFDLLREESAFLQASVAVDEQVKRLREIFNKEHITVDQLHEFYLQDSLEGVDPLVIAIYFTSKRSMVDQEAFKQFMDENDLSEDSPNYANVRSEYARMVARVFEDEAGKDAIKYQEINSPETEQASVEALNANVPLITHKPDFIAALAQFSGWGENVIKQRLSRNVSDVEKSQAIDQCIYIADDEPADRRALKEDARRVCKEWLKIPEIPTPEVGEKSLVKHGHGHSVN